MWTDFVSCPDAFRPPIHRRSIKGSFVPFFFSPLSHITHSPSFFSLFDFPFCLFLFSFPFFSLFFPYPSSTNFFFWLNLRKFPPSCYSLSHGHVSSHGPSIMCHVSPCEPCDMCHMDTCFRWHLPHLMALMPCVLLPWCHVAAPGQAMWHHPHVSTNTRCLKKCEIPTISKLNKIRLGN